MQQQTAVPTIVKPISSDDLLGLDGDAGALDTVHVLGACARSKHAENASAATDVQHDLVLQSNGSVIYGG